jgi:hypothetical protein
MEEYLELVEGSFTQEHLDKQKNQNPYVAYSIQDDKVIYTIISNEEEEIDPTEGFVDLGLSVMWAECNLGANNPGETGLFYSWGEVEGHELAEDGVSFKDGHLFDENNYQIPDKDIKCTLKLADDAVY